MEMYFCPLFSGSAGNALFCQYGNTRILIDAGKAGKTIDEALASVGVDPATLDAVLITHDHSDHIHGVGVMARRYHLPLYATQETWRAMDGKIGKIPGDLIRTTQSGKSFWLGDIGVEPFSIPHDAADPVGYRLWGGRLSVSTATDLGEFTENVYSAVRGSTLVLLESNHDPELRAAEGPDPRGSRASEQCGVRRRPAAADRRRNEACHSRTPECGKQYADPGTESFRNRDDAGEHPSGGGRGAAGGAAG